MRKSKSTKNVIERFRTDCTRVCSIYGPPVPVADKYISFETGFIHVSNELVLDILTYYHDDLNFRPILRRILRKGFLPVGVDFTVSRISDSRERGVVRCDRIVFNKGKVRLQKTRKPKYYKCLRDNGVLRRKIKERGVLSWG